MSSLTIPANIGGVAAERQRPGGHDPVCPQVTLVLGPFCSGTSALAAVVAGLGANAHPPHSVLTDGKAPDSRESRALDQIVRPWFDYDTLARTGTPPWMVSRLRVWAGPGWSVAKLPALAFFLPEAQRAWSLTVLRPRRALSDIEATRQRRGWPRVYGQAGAERIEAAIETHLDPAVPCLDVAFDTLRQNPAATVETIADFLNVPVTQSALRAIQR